MKSIKVISSNGTTIINKLGSQLDILELSTYLRTDRVDYQGNSAYIYLKG